MAEKFTGLDSERCKEKLGVNKAPCNIQGLIKEILNRLEVLENKVNNLEQEVFV